MLHAELPVGITRSPDLHSFVTLDDCRALMLHYRPDDAQPGEMLPNVIVWKGEPSAVRPLTGGDRIRDLRPGDRIDVLGVSATLLEVEIYR